MNTTDIYFLHNSIHFTEHAMSTRALHQGKVYDPPEYNVEGAVFAPHITGAAYGFDPHGRQVPTPSPSPPPHTLHKICSEQGRPTTRQYEMDSIRTKNSSVDDKTPGEQCRKRIDLSSNVPGASALVAIFCVEHGHCFGFHVVPLEGDLFVLLRCAVLFLTQLLDPLAYRSARCLSSHFCSHEDTSRDCLLRLRMYFVTSFCLFCLSG